MLIKFLLYSLSWYVSTQKEWLCLNCQTQRALQGELDNRGKMAQHSPASAKPETQVTPAVKKPESKTLPSSKDKSPIPTKTQPAPVATKVVPTAVSTLKGNLDSPQAITEAMDKAVLPATAEKLTSEVGKKPSEALEVDPKIPCLPVLQDTALSQADVPKNLTLADKVETKKTDEGLTQQSKTEQSKPIISKDHIKHEVVSIETASPPAADHKVAPSLRSTEPKLSAPEEISVEPDNQETKAVPAAESKDVTSITDTSILETEIYTKDMKSKVRLHFICI